MKSSKDLPGATDKEDLLPQLRPTQRHLDSEPISLPDGSREYRVRVVAQPDVSARSAGGNYKDLLKEFEEKTDGLRGTEAAQTRLVLTDAYGVALVMWNFGEGPSVEERNAKFAEFLVDGH